MKARVESERLPRGADPATHTKLGRGGLADVEWTVQLLQLQHAGTHPALQVTPTVEALQALGDAGLLAAEGARQAARLGDGLLHPAQQLVPPLGVLHLACLAARVHPGALLRLPHQRPRLVEVR